MNMLDYTGHSLLEVLLEAAAIRRRAESKIPPSAYKVFQGICLSSFCALIVSCTLYLTAGDGNRMMTVAIMFMAVESMAYNVLLAWKSDEITAMIKASERITGNLEMDDWVIDQLELASRKSSRITKFLSILMTGNIMSAVIVAIVKILRTDQPIYPYEESCMGLSVAPCWALQIVITSHTAYFVTLYFSTVKIIVYRLSAYYAILYRMFRDRAAEDDPKADRNLFILFNDVSSFTINFSKIFGVTAFMEIVLAAIRSSFQSYLVTMNALLKKGIRESKWYENSPTARKRLLPVILLVREPITFNYRHFMEFNMERFGQVVRSTYTLITAIANFL